MIEKKKRIVSIDLIRTIAMLLVILTHATEASYDFWSDYLFNAPLHIDIMGLGMHTLGRIGVPLFLFLSGYLLLDREYDTEKTLIFWKKNLLSLLITTELWIVIYYIYACVIYNSKFRISVLIEEMIFFRNPKINHLWYMGTIMGIYLFIPLIANVLKQYHKFEISLVFGIASIYVIGLPTINAVAKVVGRGSGIGQLNVNFVGDWSGIMLILGWMIKKGYFERVKKSILVAGAILSYISMVVMELYAYRHAVRYTVWYDSCFLLVSALCVMLLLIKVEIRKIKNVIIWLSYSSFAVYLIHNFFLVMISKVITKYNLIFPHVLKEIIIFTGTLTASEIAVWLISKNKKISRIMFAMK